MRDAVASYRCQLIEMAEGVPEAEAAVLPVPGKWCRPWTHGGLRCHFRSRTVKGLNVQGLFVAEHYGLNFAARSAAKFASAFLVRIARDLRRLVVGP
jgi:hypothetical protein